MCNEVARRIAIGAVRDDFSQLRIPLVFPEGVPNLEPRDSIRITDRALVVRQGTPADAVMRRWSWQGPTKRPVFNFRSEARQFPSGRCLVPVDAMYEFTAGAGARKDKWQFEATRGAWFAIAGLIRDDVDIGRDGRGEAFTMLTCGAGPDIAPYHDRQVVVIERGHWERWLDPSVVDITDLTVPSAANSFNAARVRG